jgi:quinoprotein glucose dehydrogenase
MKRTALTPVLTVLATLAWSAAFSAEAPKIKLEPVYAGLKLEKPISLQIPDDGTGRRFLVEQTGKIRILPAGEAAATDSLFLDMTSVMSVEKDFEEGLLGLAFHPQYKENGRFYLTFSRQRPKRLVLAEYTVLKADPNVADPASERILLEVQQPEWNHNSGNIFFDSRDGMFFLCVGDGGMKNGVHLLSQKLTSWCGKVLRIDVDSRTASLPYGIPSDNPFVGTPNAAPEIWAYGFRNPWGAAVDPETGLFYLADVGQDLYEEINVVERGGNYGWNFREASHVFPGRETLMAALGQKADPPKEAVLLDPIHEYSRADGLSITGGFVYRGKAIPALQGHFVYGDWRFGNLWALKYDAADNSVVNHLIEKPADVANPTTQPTGFFPDENGEILVLDWRGAIHRIVPAE